jgi:molybdopterin/thiamine biosynthesis adenylyltransferase
MKRWKLKAILIIVMESSATSSSGGLIMPEVSYMRQKDLFDPVNQKYKIVILGAGSLGSFIALNLAKLGFNDLTVYDFDKVEEHNIPNQFYRVSDIGKQKVEALKEIIKEFASVDVKICDEKVDSKTKLPIDLDNIFVITFDTLEARKVAFDLLKDYNFRVLDVRAGGEEYNIQTINTSEEDEVKTWEKSFDITPTELPCGARSVIYTNLSVASEVCNIIKKINNDEEYPKKLIRHMRKYLILNDLNKIQGGN